MIRKDCDDTDDEDELVTVIRKDDAADGSRRWSSDEEIWRSRGREGPAISRGDPAVEIVSVLESSVLRFFF